MSNNKHKSAAVPFVNQKGERSMKKVKVERYVAGKKPSFANDDDDDDEYYTTDEEEEQQQQMNDSSSEEDRHSEEQQQSDNESPPRKTATTTTSLNQHQLVAHDEQPQNLQDHDEEDDDPRFARLRQIESKAPPDKLLSVQTASRAPIENRFVIEDEDDEEAEEDIKQRHTLARKQIINEPVAPKTVLPYESNELIDTKEFNIDPDVAGSSRGNDTEDFLKDLVITAIPRRQFRKKGKNAKLEGDIMDMIEHAKQEAVFTSQLYKRIDEDNKRELDIEARNKNNFRNSDMNAIITDDDEDDESSYEEWKLREMKRVLRDRSAREVVEAK